jgi:hypothetical protein
VRDGRPQAQFAALQYGFTSQGQLKVESKEEMRDRGVPSPDRADALALAFAADLAPWVSTRRRSGQGAASQVWVRHRDEVR